MNSSPLARRVFLTAALGSVAGAAMGRIPYGGALALHFPWRCEALDPHADDALAACFGPAIADSLFALTPAGRPYPTLASAPPQQHPEGVAVRLRPGLRTARGRSLDARDAVWSLERAHHGTACAALHGLTFRLGAREANEIVIRGAAPDALARALASPAAAILPRNFNPKRPDGTGAFRALPSGSVLSLQRNERAARGPAFLARVEVRSASDLVDMLRDFEAGQTQIGWFGAGLHRQRSNTIAFASPELGWVVLRTGHRLGSWDAPGVAQTLVNSLPRHRFDRLGLSGGDGSHAATPLPASIASVTVDGSSPYMLEVARTLASALSSEGRRLDAHPVSPTELRRLRSQRDYQLMVDFVRATGNDTAARYHDLLAASDRRLLRAPPRPSSFDPEVVCQQLQLAVLGALRIQGVAPTAYQRLGEWELGRVWYAAPTSI